MNWFLIKTKYPRIDDEGKMKNVSEEYLVDAVSFGEAETRITEKLTEYLSQELSINEIIKDISKTNYVDVFRFDDGDFWHKCKIVYEIPNETGTKNKKITEYMLVNALNVEQAYNRIYESTSEFTVDIKVTRVDETKIVEVFEYNN